MTHKQFVDALSRNTVEAEEKVVTCSDCEGDGISLGKTCPECNGEGVVDEGGEG